MPRIRRKVPAPVAAPVRAPRTVPCPYDGETGQFTPSADGRPISQCAACGKWSGDEG